MRFHPRIRRAIKWGKYGGAAVAALLVVVWIGSGWFVALWQSSGGQRFVSVGSGLLSAGSRADAVHGPGFEVFPTEYFFQTRFAWHDAERGYWVEIPLWCPALLAALSCAVAWRFDTLIRRRNRTDSCPRCGYDRAGLAPGAVCPECGAGRQA